MISGAISSSAGKTGIKMAIAVQLLAALIVHVLGAWGAYVLATTAVEPLVGLVRGVAVGAASTALMGYVVCLIGRRLSGRRLSMGAAIIGGYIGVVSGALIAWAVAVPADAVGWPSGLAFAVVPPLLCTVIARSWRRGHAIAGSTTPGKGELPAREP